MVRYGGLAGNDHAEPGTVPPWSAADGKSLYSSGDDDTVRLLARHGDCDAAAAGMRP